MVQVSKAEEAATIRRVAIRLLPLLVICYIAAALDRVNVGFAALTMNKDIGLTAASYGLGAGLFFVAYFFFEVPSNLLLERFGARKWIARIMFSWGLVSGGMAFVQGEHSFYALRLLLGVAEAGFFPGVLFYLTLWFPKEYRGRIVGAFMAAIPLASLIGAPISGYILSLGDFGGLKGWQWLFIIEAIPSILLAFVVYFYLTDRPSDATWLTPRQRAWLTNCLAAEHRKTEETHCYYSVKSALLSGRVLTLAAVYFGAVAANYGVGFFLPLIVKGFGFSSATTGLVAAIPYLFGVVAMLLWGMHSDRSGERVWHCASGLALAALGIGGCALLQDPTWKILAISVGVAGVFGCLPSFWALPTAFLSGRSAAAGIAAINSIGNLAGFSGPYAMGILKDATGNFDAGLTLIASLALAAAVLVVLISGRQAKGATAFATRS